MKNLYPTILCVLALCLTITRVQGRTPSPDFAGHSTFQMISDGDGHPNELALVSNSFSSSAVFARATHIEDFNAKSNSDSTIEAGKTIDSFRVNSTEKDFRDSSGITAGFLHFSDKILAPPGNDNFAGAPDISSLINTSCTSGGLYTTVGATPDQSKGTCWNNGPNNNVWFKFIATATGFINVQVKVSGAGETLRNPFVAIFDASLTQVACENYQGSAVDLSLSNLGLVPGNTYYIAVDNYAGYAGSFDLCLTDVPDYDYPIGAKNVNSLINTSCTSGGTYTTQFATPDDAKGTCWSNGPNNNRWFKFTATATGFINVQVKVSGAGETLRNPFLAIFDASLTQVACQNYQGSAVDLSLSNLGLVPGNTYYIAVDNFAGYAGSFDLCLTDVPDYDYPIGAKNVNSLINTSCTSGGTYTTQFATPDDASGTCWSNGPNNNRWFKFTATATGFINVQVKVSGAGETLRNPFLAIFDASLTQVACQNYQGSAVDLSLSNLGLVPGNTYYIAVDNYVGYAGSFDLCLTDVPDYDYPIGAKNVNSLIDASCTSGGVYTTQFATPDDAGGTCWSNGPNNNRWFKFTATATGFINVQVKVSGAGETLRNPFVAIFDASFTQVACQNYQGSAVDLSLSSLGLVPGNTYYIAVDNNVGYAGSFDLCLTDVPDYDYPIGAKDVNSLINSSCTSGGIYTTQFATPDDAKGACWSNGPNNNRWFKFTATATGFINVQVKVSGAGETLRNPFVAIFDASFAQVACQNYQGSAVDLSLSSLGLVPGNTYYIAVDNYAGYAGSFDLCLSDVPDYDYPIGAKDVNSLINSSCTSGGIYTTQFATPDDAKGNCWSNGPNNNRWFKFTATATGFINVQVKVSGAGETLRNPFVAIFDASFAQVACQNYQGAAIDQCLGVSNLIPGNTYYIAVDNYAGYAGSFDLCLSDAVPATISYPGTPFCASGTANVTQTGQAGGTYSSQAGLSINAATGAINLTATTGGSYKVTYALVTANCVNTVTTLVTVNALPVATISYPGSPYCATGTATVSLIGQVGGTYSSTAGLSLNVSTGAINLGASTAGVYTVTYTFSNGTCSNSTTKNVTITALPTATISYAGNPYCATGNAAVTRIGQAGGTYSSTAGLSLNVATGAINLVTSTVGTYTVTYSFTSGACSNTTTTSITINPLPAATISYPGTPFCATGAAAVTQTGQGGGTYSSTAGLSITAATGAINLAASTAGVYTVTYSFSNGTCSNTTTASVTINALPVATISYAASPYCATGNAAVTRVGQAGGTYSSTAGLSITAATGAINLGTSTAGTYTVTYSFTNGTCNNTTTTSVTIKALPIATISYAGSPYCATGTATVTQTGQAGGTYSSTAGLSITAATGTINLATSTAGTYTVTYTFSNGTCNNTTTASVTIKALPSAIISYAGSPYCATGNATVTQTGQAGGTYSSTAGLSITAATGAINLATSTAGTYTVTYSFTSGTCSNTATASITIKALPAATISYSGSPYCATGTATVTQTGQAGGTYSSTAGLIITAATGAINLATSTPGTYTVTYSFSNGTCSNTTTTSVTINALPIATISYSGSPYCATGTATVTQAGQAGGTYSSTAGLNITAATGAINLATSTTGTYTVTYSFTNGTCSNTATTSVTINPLPAATISYSGSPYCATGTATVTQTGQAGGTYSSTAGLSITAATGAINLVTSTAGTYTVTYSFSNGTCSNTTTTSVTINALPAATISYAGSPYCATGTATVTQTGQAGGTYSSTVGLNITAATGTVNLATSTPGTYTVTYSFTNGTCSNTTTTITTINALPIATISYVGSPYCATGTATVTQTGQAGGTYSSTAGLNITVATGAINLATSTPGTYTVTYSFTNGTCSNTSTTSVTINALPNATISYSGSPYCATGTATVTQTGQAGGAYSSTAGLNITAGTGAINLATSTPGTYTVTYSFTNGTCSSTTTSSITINPLPAATISYAASPYCATGTANVTQTGQGGGTYSSTAGLSITAATGAINLATSTPGTYTVTYNFTNGTCSNTTIVSVTINALPVATISYAASPYCATGTATVTQTGQGGGTYSSTAGLNITAATGTIDLVTSTPGTYTVTYSFTNGTCSNTTTASVTINALPIATISYAGNPYCATGTATVTQTGQAGGTYSSTAGLNISAAIGDINLVTSTPGTYTVTYSFGNGTCSNTTTTSVTINALPVATISYTGSPYCSTGTATVTQTGQGGGTYNSTAGLNITAATGDINLATSTPGTYAVTYSFSNGTCSNTAITSVTIDALPTATISYASSPYCATGTATVTQTGQVGGTYSSTAGLNITAATGDINLTTSTPGTYTVTYSFTNGTCSNSASTTVAINALPSAIISYAASPYCATGTATVTQTGQAGGTYSSTPGLNITVATGDINLATSTPGTYTITYSFTNGTCNNTTTASITINALPAATISYSGSPYCATGTATVTQTGQAGGTYSSTAGLNITAASGDINLVTSTPGTYTVTYSFTNGTCSNTTTNSITINALPTATISYAGSPYCATGTATVTQTGQAGGTYSSTPGLNITPATGDINLATSTPGTYTVTYSFNSGGCSNSATTSITTIALPTATISYSGSPYCATGTATATQTGQVGGTYSSTAGLNITPATGDINLSTSTPGVYTVTYTFTSGACSNTTTTSVTINALPAATISYAGSPFCAVATGIVTQTGQAGGTYSAPVGVVINAATGDINLPATTPGTYTITYSFSNGTCSNTAATSVTITLSPVVVITNPPAACSPATVDITVASVTAGSTAGLIYSYYQDASATIPLANPNAIALSGTYYIQGATPSGCNSIQPVVVTINPKPSVVITNPAAVCWPGTINITTGSTTAGSTAGLTYSYYQDAGATIVLPNPNAINLSGTYYIQGTTALGCSDIQPVVVTINPLPAATISYNGSPYCTQGTAFVSMAGQGGGIYASTPGLVINSATGDIDLSSSAEGTYTIVYTFSNGTCGNSSITSVTIKNPFIQVNNPPGTCFPGTVDLTNPAVTAGSEIGLDFSFYQDASGLVPVVNPAAMGTGGVYFVQGVNNSTGCASDLSAVVVTIFPKPAITASSSETDICKGSSVTLTASSPGNTIDWVGIGSGNSVSVTPADSTEYLAIAITPDGCMDTATVDVAVQPFKINLSATPDPVLAGTSTTLTTTGNFTYNIISWSPDIFFTDQTALTQTIVVKDTSKSFTVIGQSTDGCLDTAILNVVVDPNLKDFFIPNSFSPNNDGNNDIFKVYGSSVKEVILLIYNQWGELISETYNTQGWDGTWKGRPQEVGVYIYEAKVTFYNNVTIKRKGTVNLIR